jgi:hypothetical protein
MLSLQINLENNFIESIENQIHLKIINELLLFFPY